MPHWITALFKVFFPSWKFFDELGEPPVLYYRLIFSNGEPGPWLVCMENQTRGFGALFLNAQGNLRMACNSLVERLIGDVNETPVKSPADISNSVSYQLVQNLVRNRVGAARFQFKIVSGKEDILVSPLQEISE